MQWVGLTEKSLMLLRHEKANQCRLLIRTKNTQKFKIHTYHHMIAN